MKPQEMAQSMKALRLAANFRHSPRQRRTASKLSCTSDSDVSGRSDADNAIKPTKSELQEQLRKQVPVGATEIARIESIFSSNNES